MGRDGLIIDTIQSKGAERFDSSVLCQQHHSISLEVKINYM